MFGCFRSFRVVRGSSSSFFVSGKILVLVLFQMREVLVLVGTLDLDHATLLAIVFVFAIYNMVGLGPPRGSSYSRL